MTGWLALVLVGLALSVLGVLGAVAVVEVHHRRPQTPHLTAAVWICAAVGSAGAWLTLAGSIGAAAVTP